MKDHDVIEAKIDEVNQAFLDKDLKRLANMACDYIELMQYIDKEEIAAYNNAAIPMADSWKIGYWKALDKMQRHFFF